MMSTMEDFKKDSWGVHPVLDVPDLFPPAVMFGILDSDPHPKFTENFRRMSEKQKQHEIELQPPLTPDLMRQSLLSAAWDAVFQEVPGNQIAMLIRNEGRPAGSNDAGGAMFYSVGIKSNGSPGTKWLVTRATRFGGKAVCWCIPVDVEKGKTIDVSLSLQNMIALEN